MITYHSVVLICSDILRTRKFYESLFGLTVELDIDGLVCFKEGISLWKRSIAADLVYNGTSPSPPVERPDQEIYFETDNIESFFSTIQKASVRLLHPVQLTPWQQKTIRFFDPDDHLIEVGESMEEVIRRLAREGNNPEKVSEMTLMPVEIVTALLGGSVQGT